MNAGSVRAQLVEAKRTVRRCCAPDENHGRIGVAKDMFRDRYAYVSKTACDQINAARPPGARPCRLLDMYRFKCANPAPAATINHNGLAGFGKKLCGKVLHQPPDALKIRFFCVDVNAAAEQGWVLLRDHAADSRQDGPFRTDSVPAANRVNLT